MLDKPKSIHSLCKWLNNTPFIGPQNLIPEDHDDPSKKVQTQPAFFNAMESGVVALLARLCEGSRVGTLLNCLGKINTSKE